MSSPAPHDARLGETIDLVADLNAQDNDGFGWSLLSRALDPARVTVGSMLVAGNSQAIAVVRVVAVDDDGQVHFSVLPAAIDKNRHLSTAISGADTVRDVFEIDIPCDPTQIDDTGLPWTFLDEAAHPERIVVGATVMTGDEQDPVLARVVSMTRRLTGVKVHLEVLPSDPVAEI